MLNKKNYENCIYFSSLKGIIGTKKYLKFENSKHTST
jgi:hypothetical protein